MGEKLEEGREGGGGVGVGWGGEWGEGGRGGGGGRWWLSDEVLCHPMQQRPLCAHAAWRT